MSVLPKIRAAAAQFHVGDNVEQNLATCLRALDQAAKEKPHVIVLPEFCNHVSWYEDQAHCRGVSVDFNSDFLRAIAQKAKDIGSHIAVNVTLNKSPTITTGTSVLFGPDGVCLATCDKQVLIGHETEFLVKATQCGPVIHTDVGALGLYACMDGVINETPRSLALRGAHTLLNSLNSFARDEASLHVPVRAAENKVFVVAANKIGPLVPEDKVAFVSEATGIPASFLEGAGQSQIVGPDGTVLAIAPQQGDAIVFAEFDPSLANDKDRPDGTNIFTARRPELYAPIAANPAQQTTPAYHGINCVEAALVHGNGPDDTLGLIVKAIAEGARIIGVAPIDGLIAQAVAPLCPDGVYVGIATREGTSLLVSSGGVVLTQEPLHTTRRYGKSRCDGFQTLMTPYGRIGLVAGDDGIFPEAFRLLAMMGVQIAIAPVSPMESWELQTGLLERAAENRLNLLAPATGPDFGFAAALQEDFTIMTAWKTRPFDGLLSHPIVTRATSALSHVTLYPKNAANKLVSRNTDLLINRPWHLASAIVR